MPKNYKHILLPLDGSELAELALKDAFGLAELSRAKVTLLQVIQPDEYGVSSDMGHSMLLNQQLKYQKMLAHEYLNDICSRIKCRQLSVHTAVEIGLIAETIIDYARQHSVDLIVMATHGRSGVQRWVYGSVADKVLRGADLPVLLVRARPKNGTASGPTAAHHPFS